MFLQVRFVCDILQSVERQELPANYVSSRLSPPPPSHPTSSNGPGSAFLPPTARTREVGNENIRDQIDLLDVMMYQGF